MYTGLAVPTSLDDGVYSVTITSANVMVGTPPARLVTAKIVPCDYPEIESSHAIMER